MGVEVQHLAHIGARKHRWTFWPVYSWLPWISSIRFVRGIAPKQRVDRLADLKVERPVLHLHDDVVGVATPQDLLFKPH